MEQWKTIEPGMWKPQNPGDSIEGFLISSTPGNKEKNLSAKYILEKDGLHTLVWGSSIIDERMKMVKLGDYIRVTYKETVKNAKKQDLKIFKLEVREQEA